VKERVNVRKKQHKTKRLQWKRLKNKLERRVPNSKRRVLKKLKTRSDKNQKPKKQGKQAKKRIHFSSHGEKGKTAKDSLSK
jgi:hypothetical protein